MNLNVIETSVSPPKDKMQILEVELQPQTLANSYSSLVVIAILCLLLLNFSFCLFYRTLDVQPNRVTVGGIRSVEPILQRRGQVESHDFVGCIMEFAVNGRPLEPSQALAAQGILDQYVCYIWYQIDSIYDIESQHENQALFHSNTTRYFL